MKSILIKYLREDRSFDNGVRLYMEHGHSISLKTSLNRQGYSDYNHKLLLEELRKCANVSVEELNALAIAPLKEKEQPIPATSDVHEFVLAIPEEIRKVFRLREEFPFLSQPDCPNELKILVADMITLHANYVAAHKNLFAAMQPEDIYEASATIVEDYIGNREIWAELEHYKKNGTILGKHKLFSIGERFAEIQNMPVASLVKLNNSLKGNISKTKKKIQEDPENPKIKEWTDKLDNFESESKEVNRLLGINE